MKSQKRKTNSLIVTAVALAAFSIYSFPVFAKIIGNLVPALPLTDERIAQAPVNQRPFWEAYKKRSDLVAKQSAESVKAEFTAGQTKPNPVPEDRRRARLSTNESANWYRSEVGRNLIASVISFQMPSGGWYKTAPRSIIRQSGQGYSPEFSAEATIDNDATSSELKFLSKAALYVDEADRPLIEASINDGVAYLLAAQYPNGGWPQMWPLRGGYHDAITLNDDAYLNVLEVLADVANGKDGFKNVPANLKEKANGAYLKGINLLLSLQVVSGGRKSIWGQQYDALTLTPTSARNYEMASLASGESANILLYFMTFDNPPQSAKIAIKCGVEFFETHKIVGKAWDKKEPNGDRQLFDKPDAPPLWSRYYDINTGKSIFGDRDKAIYDDVNDISAERRNGYSWFNTSGSNVIANYTRWRTKYNRNNSLTCPRS